MSRKRVTIYDLAHALNISPSYVSRALSNDPNINAKTKALVQSKAQELNYKQNTNAFNLRKGITKTIGVVVPKINEIFFANTIAGIEEACSENNHHLIICQSEESYAKEVKAIETLIRHNVDCILISISVETDSGGHLQQIIRNNIHLIQFDRVREEVESFTIKNDNLEAAYAGVKHLVRQGYRKIAYIGGPGFLRIYSDRKQGFTKAMEEAGIKTPLQYIIEGELTKAAGFSSAQTLLTKANCPDAIFCSSDNVALGVLQAAAALKISVPDELGVMGFQNEPFGELLTPSLSTIDQNSKQLGKHAANVYFNILAAHKQPVYPAHEIIPCSIQERDSTKKNTIEVLQESLLTA